MGINQHCQKAWTFSEFASGKKNVTGCPQLYGITDGQWVCLQSLGGVIMGDLDSVSGYPQIKGDPLPGEWQY